MTPWTFDALIPPAAAKYGVPVPTIRALIQYESNWNIDAIGDGGAAHGCGQMHEGACQDVGADWARLVDPGVPAAERAAMQVNALAAYLAKMLAAFVGNEAWALAAYNQGETVCRRAKAYAEAVLALKGKA